MEMRRPEVARPEVTRERTEEEKVLFSLVEAAKSSDEIAQKLSDILVESLDKEKLKKMVIDQALKDYQLRNKIMLELIKKL
jgi:hypothetical protein